MLYHTLMLAHHVLRRSEPEKLAGLFCRRSEVVRDRQTRQDEAFCAASCKYIRGVACGQRRLVCRAAMMYSAAEMTGPEGTLKGR